MSEVTCHDWLIRSQDISQQLCLILGDRILSNTPGAEPPRDARDSGSTTSHSKHVETSSSDQP